MCFNLRWQILRCLLQCVFFYKIQIFCSSNKFRDYEPFLFYILFTFDIWVFSNQRQREGLKQSDWKLSEISIYENEKCAGRERRSQAHWSSLALSASGAPMLEGPFWSEPLNYQPPEWVNGAIQNSRSGHLCSLAFPTCGSFVILVPMLFVKKCLVSLFS